MADILKIQDVLHRICFASDEHDLEMLASCYADDAQSSFGKLVGRDAIVERTRKAWEWQEQAGIRTRHILTNTFLSEEGLSSATVNSFISLYYVNEGMLSLRMTGRYLDAMRTYDGVWRLQNRVLYQDVPYSLNRDRIVRDEKVRSHGGWTIREIQ